METATRYVGAKNIPMCDAHWRAIDTKKEKPMPKQERPKCKCGCGKPAGPSSYARGHWQRGRKKANGRAPKATAANERTSEISGSTVEAIFAALGPERKAALLNKLPELQ